MTTSEAVDTEYSRLKAGEKNKILNDEKEEYETKKKCCDFQEKARNLIAYFILGLMNNFAYVVFLSAALDILGNKLPPALVLLADIFPGLAVQAVAPFFFEKIPYAIRVWIITLLAVGSFVIVGAFNPVWVRILGVVLASISSGLGEITYMALSSYYHKNTISFYSSGTGAAGILGSLMYLALTTWAKLSDRITLYICAPLPLAMVLSYFVLMENYKKKSSYNIDTINSDLKINDTDQKTLVNSLPLKKRIQLQWPLIPYTAPLFLVYFAEYTINQSIVPAIVFPKSKIGWPQEDVYRYYQFIYQIGVFISRSSVNIFPIKRLWTLGFWQLANMIFLGTVAYYYYIPNVWIIFVIILYEGLLGGAVYVNAFYLVSGATHIEKRYKEFCLSSISFWYAYGILLSSIAGLFLAPWLSSHAYYNYWPPTAPPTVPTRKH
eukprot:TRINITY_DN5093_c0_g1_i2.p1 TRINITY_DN5093_c0_g1~~TRINITY_DN5093_c0_g1_i2.p1  ORF type:complete len:436 (+),score=47.59 TRINITY_DN5093_c0_g1_i2:80-1387(+)